MRSSSSSQPPLAAESRTGGGTLRQHVASGICFRAWPPPRPLGPDGFVCCFLWPLPAAPSGCGAGRRPVLGRCRPKEAAGVEVCRPATKLSRPPRCRTFSTTRSCCAVRHTGELHDAAHLACRPLGDEAGWQAGQGPSPPANQARPSNPSSPGRRRRKLRSKGLAVPVGAAGPASVGGAARAAGPQANRFAFQPWPSSQPWQPAGVKVRALRVEKRSWRQIVNRDRW